MYDLEKLNFQFLFLKISPKTPKNIFLPNTKTVTSKNRCALRDILITTGTRLEDFLFHYRFDFFVGILNYLNL